jgi:hypothetical protein
MKLRFIIVSDSIAVASREWPQGKTVSPILAAAIHDGK